MLRVVVLLASAVIAGALSLVGGKPARAAGPLASYEEAGALVAILGESSSPDARSPGAPSPALPRCAGEGEGRGGEAPGGGAEHGAESWQKDRATRDREKGEVLARELGE